jgi:hypothetical protein
MNNRKLLQLFLGIALILGVISGCSTTTSTPTATPTSEPATPTSEPATPTSEPATPTTEPANQYSDEHVEIVLDKTERMQELPEDLSGAVAEQDKEFIVFYFSVTGIKRVHITSMLGSRDNPMTLVVDSGEVYSMNNGNVTGVKPIDLTNITAGYELVEGAECIFIFEVPENTQPVSLTIIYSYKQNLDDEDAVSVELIIDL